MFKKDYPPMFSFTDLPAEHGFKTGEGTMRENSAATLALFAQHRERMLQGIQAMPNMPITAGYALLGLAASKQPVDKLSVILGIIFSEGRKGITEETQRTQPDLAPQPSFCILCVGRIWKRFNR